MTAEVILCCGVGGVGKTTLTAALAVRHAREGRRVVAVTIDPARRLADALGAGAIGATPTPVAVPGAPGSLDAMMLDPKAAFDRTIERQAPDPETARRLLQNRYYREVSARLAGSAEYMALEVLHELAHDGHWDVVVVDTPPARDALDVLRAPERLRRVFDPSVIGTWLEPRSRLVRALTRTGVDALSRIVGGHVVDDIADFFRLVSGLTEGFAARSAAVAALLASERSRVYLVVDASAPDRADAAAFLDEIDRGGLTFAGFLVNRFATDPGPIPDDLGHVTRPPDLAPDDWAAALDALVGAAQRLAGRAARQAAAIDTLVARAEVPAWTVPDAAGATRSLDGLAALGARLPPSPPAVLP